MIVQSMQNRHSIVRKKTLLQASCAHCAWLCNLQVKARGEALAQDEAQHQQLKEESKKQVSAASDCGPCILACFKDECCTCAWFSQLAVAVLIV